MVPATGTNRHHQDGSGTILMVLLIIRAGADHSPDGADGPTQQSRTGQAGKMIRMVLVLVSLIKLTKLISNKLWC
jgi:hypothetical protein